MVWVYILSRSWVCLFGFYLFFQFLGIRFSWAIKPKAYFKPYEQTSNSGYWVTYSGQYVRDATIGEINEHNRSVRDRNWRTSLENFWARLTNQKAFDAVVHEWATHGGLKKRVTLLLTGMTYLLFWNILPYPVYTVYPWVHAISKNPASDIIRFVAVDVTYAVLGILLFNCAHSRMYEKRLKDDKHTKKSKFFFAVKTGAIVFTVLQLLRSFLQVMPNYDMILGIGMIVLSVLIIVYLSFAIFHKPTT